MLKLACVAVLLWASCSLSPPIQRRPDPAGATAAAASAHVVPPGERPRSGSTVAVSADGKELFVVDRAARALLRAQLPLPAASAWSRVELPGVPGELAVVGERVLVTIAEPSLLLWLDRAGVEARRLPMPAGAGALAVSGDGATALVVSAAAAAVTAIDVTAGAQRWSVGVAAEPRRAVWSADGTRARVTHFLGGPSVIEGLEGGAPRVAAAPAGAIAGDGAIDGVGALDARGATVLAHRRWQGGEMHTELELVGDGGPAEAWKSDALPPNTFVRALVARPSVGTVLIVTDEELVELSPPEPKAIARTALSSQGEPCRNASGVALSADEATAFVVCGGGELRSVKLGAGSPGSASGKAERITTADPEPAPPCPAVAAGTDLLSASYRKKFLRFDRVEKVLRAYRCRYPDRTKLIELAESHGKRKVLALMISPNARLDHQRPSFFINAGHHGDELLAVNFGLDAIAALLEEDIAASGPLAELTYVVAPLVNPDGNWHKLEEGLFGRKNGRDNNKDGQREHREGVDLNRNYPYRWGTLGEEGSSAKPKDRWYRGPKAGSEPEVQGVMRLADNEKFVASMSFHTGTLALLAPYTIPGVQQPEPDAAWIVAQEMLAKMPAHPEGPTPLMRRLYALDGCDQDWLRHTHGTLAMLWEGGKKWLSMDPVRSEMIAAARASWVTLAERAAAGPTVSGRVLDALGNPVVAAVSVAEVHHGEGERWLSRCRDGRFDQVLPAPGDYTVVVTAGDVEVRRKVTVAPGARAQLDVVLPVLVKRAAECATGAGAAGAPAELAPLPGLGAQ
jgi:hypothetical protein